MRPSTQLSRSLRHYVAHNLALLRADESRSEIAAPNLPIRASIPAARSGPRSAPDSAFRGDGEAAHNDDHIRSHARSRPTVTAGYRVGFSYSDDYPHGAYGDRRVVLAAIYGAASLDLIFPGGAEWQAHIGGLLGGIVCGFALRDHPASLALHQGRTVTGPTTEEEPPGKTDHAGKCRGFSAHQVYRVQRDPVTRARRRGRSIREPST